MGKCFVERNRALRNALREIVAVDEFHDERGHAARLFEPVYGRNVRVVQRREDFGFPLKTRELIVVSGKRWRQNLDRDLALQLGIGGPIYFAHASGADLRGDLVDAESSAWSQSQTAGSIAFRVARTRSLLCNGVVASLTLQTECCRVSSDNVHAI